MRQIHTGPSERKQSNTNVQIERRAQTHGCHPSYPQIGFRKIDAGGGEAKLPTSQYQPGGQLLGCYAVPHDASSRCVIQHREWAAAAPLFHSSPTCILRTVHSKHCRALLRIQSGEDWTINPNPKLGGSARSPQPPIRPSPLPRHSGTRRVCWEGGLWGRGQQALVPVQGRVLLQLVHHCLVDGAFAELPQQPLRRKKGNGGVRSPRAPPPWPPHRFHQEGDNQGSVKEGPSWAPGTWIRARSSQPSCRLHQEGGGP